MLRARNVGLIAGIEHLARVQLAEFCKCRSGAQRDGLLEVTKLPWLERIELAEVEQAGRMSGDFQQIRVAARVPTPPASTDPVRSRGHAAPKRPRRSRADHRTTNRIAGPSSRAKQSGHASSTRSSSLQLRSPSIRRLSAPPLLGRRQRPLRSWTAARRRYGSPARSHALRPWHPARPAARAPAVRGRGRGPVRRRSAPEAISAIEGAPRWPARPAGCRAIVNPPSDPSSSSTSDHPRACDLSAPGTPSSSKHGEPQIGMVLVQASRREPVRAPAPAGSRSCTHPRRSFYWCGPPSSRGSDAAKRLLASRQ